jgi:hypothetical protein
VTVVLGGSAAGAEIGFTHTAGLSFTGFEPSASVPGAQQIKAERDGVTWVGIFTDANIYGSAGGGSLGIGNLVFAYTGDGESSVTLTACTIYTVDAEGEPVRDARNVGGTVTVKRAADTGTPGTSGSSGTGSGSTAKTDDEFVVELTEDETPLATTNATFSDISQAEWAREAIEYMAANKGILGMGDGLFAPNAEVTRAQFSRFTAQAFGFERGTEAASFTDVSESAWYYADVTTLASNGILTGYDDGRFGPDDKISREQMAAIIDRALTAKGITLSASRTFDLDDISAASEYTKVSIEKLYGAGVINGMGDGSFAPKATATRAQSCVILYNALKAANLA